MLSRPRQTGGVNQQYEVCQGVMTAKVLRNGRPADIPVERPVRMQLVINLKTAAALGIDVPPGLLTRADEVIE